MVMMLSTEEFLTLLRKRLGNPETFYQSAERLLSPLVFYCAVKSSPHKHEMTARHLGHKKENCKENQVQQLLHGHLLHTYTDQDISDSFLAVQSFSMIGPLLTSEIKCLALFIMHC
jgi:hypothetical protein